MARRPRLLAPGVLYHVIVRGNHQQKTLLNPSDYQAYLERLGRYRRQLGVTGNIGPWSKEKKGQAGFKFRRVRELRKESFRFREGNSKHHQQCLESGWLPEIGQF